MFYQVQHELKRRKRNHRCVRACESSSVMSNFIKFICNVEDDFWIYSIFFLFCLFIVSFFFFFLKKMSLFSKFTKGNHSTEKSIYPWSQRKLNGASHALPRFGHGATMLDNQHFIIYGGIHSRGNTKKNAFIVNISKFFFLYYIFTWINKKIDFINTFFFR